jgi:Fanconi-associated nuclease 1
MPSLLDFFETRRPSAKRQKVSHEVNLEKLSARDDGGSVKNSDAIHSELPSLSRKDTEFIDPADLSVGNEDSGNIKSSQTDLEISLPPIKTDEDAIKEYENFRAPEVEETEHLSLKQRLGERKWHKGKSSIYVDAFNLALETVLNEEAHLFDQTELDVFRRWKDLNYEAQYLLVNLCNPKSHQLNVDILLICGFCYSDMYGFFSAKRPPGIA